VAVADADADHPHRRFWLSDFRSPAGETSQWQVSPDVERAEPDLVLSEALHCTENGWRSQTTAYVCGPMRDAGGYQSTRALWAVTIARDRGCLDRSASLLRFTAGQLVRTAGTSATGEGLRRRRLRRAHAGPPAFRLRQAVDPQLGASAYRVAVRSG
jgi:hypothetical protein